LSKSAFFKGGWVTLSANFRRKVTSPTDIFRYQKTRVMTLSCDIKISTVGSFVSSQSTRVIDGWTNRQTDRITIQDRASVAASRGKNCLIHSLVRRIDLGRIFRIIGDNSLTYCLSASPNSQARIMTKRKNLPSIPLDFFM